VSDTLLVYGAYGYTGRLVAERAVDAGLDPVLGGRDERKLSAVGDDLDCDTRTFGLSDPETVAYALDGVDALLNCAGPFEATADPAVEACIATGTHYLDVTGEVPVFVRLHRRDAAAREAGVTVLPGVGFDVVPTDCTAAHLAEQLPEATHIDLGFETRGGLSPGTARTAIEGIANGGAARVDGTLRAEPVAARTRTIDFGAGAREAASIPWGDVATAGWTTGIGNVVVYTPVPPAARRVLAAAARLAPVLGADPVQRLLAAAVDRFVAGPDADERAAGRAFVWGEARVEADGAVVDAVTSRLETPETYALTADTAVAAARRVLAGGAGPGFATPAGAFGADFVIEATDASRS
jgi:short subunit dehydrogenase-like uncharacterized protein